MPALDKASVEQWMRRHEPDAAARAITADIQADDMPGVLSEMIRLGHALDRAAAHDPNRLDLLLQQPVARSGMRTVLGHASPARRVRLLDWLSGAALPNRHLVTGGLLADEPGVPPEADAGRIARESIRQLNRGALLARLFSPERITRLLSTCNNGEDAPCDA